MSDNIVLFSSYAKLPAGTVSAEVFHVMALVVLVDMDTGTIVDAECTLSTRLSERFTANLLKGRHLENDLPVLVQELTEVYQGNAKKTIVAALRSLHDKYLKFLRDQAPEEQAGEA